jgi:tRNA(fMet)-specific endonuclease VapC
MTLEIRTATPANMSAIAIGAIGNVVLPWGEEVATCYGKFCATLEAQGINLSDFDMMIAAHAVAVNATLVSRDKAFSQVPEPRLALEIW